MVVTSHDFWHTNCLSEAVLLKYYFTTTTVILIIINNNQNIQEFRLFNESFFFIMMLEQLTWHVLFYTLQEDQN